MKKNGKFGLAVSAVLVTGDTIYLPARVRKFLLQNPGKVDEINTKVHYLIYKEQHEKNDKVA